MKVTILPLFLFVFANSQIFSQKNKFKTISDSITIIEKNTFDLAIQAFDLDLKIDSIWQWRQYKLETFSGLKNNPLQSTDNETYMFLFWKIHDAISFQNDNGLKPTKEFDIKRINLNDFLREVTLQMIVRENNELVKRYDYLYDDFFKNIDKYKNDKNQVVNFKIQYSNFAKLRLECKSDQKSKKKTELQDLLIKLKETNKKFEKEIKSKEFIYSTINNDCKKIENWYYSKTESEKKLIELVLICKQELKTQYKENGPNGYSNYFHKNFFECFDEKTRIKEMEKYQKYYSSLDIVSESSTISNNSGFGMGSGVSESKLVITLSSPAIFQIKGKTVYPISKLEAAFPGGETAWEAYCKKKNGKNVFKSKDKKRVLIKFIVTENGEITALKFENKEDENPENREKLAYLFKDIPNWIPAKINDENILSEVFEQVYL